MILSRYNLKNISAQDIVTPAESVFDLPEKVLQFGTGVLLRGLPDYFIDKANRQGIFNGRVVVVKSTDSDSSAFDKQDGLYTLCVRGLDGGKKIEENIVNSSISRVLSAKDEWSEVLQCAHNPHMQIIISNTTEVGIQLVQDDIHRLPPVSYPGKLLAFLIERYKAFDGSRQSGMVIVPTELIPDNGKKLESIVLELAHLNGLDDTFIQWLENCNYFCSSLVDRIVPGKPDSAIREQLEKQHGYKDELLTMSEVYRLWAIEGGEHIKSVLTFASVDEGVVIAPDINLFRELKLRMLNGTHTLSCGLAYLAGFGTVKQAMDDASMQTFISQLMLNEIATGIPYNVEPGVSQTFGHKVLDRFANPNIEHLWINITMQYTSKMKMRNVPVILKYAERIKAVPENIALGFAAYLLFLKPVIKKQDKYYGEWQGKEYLIQDDFAAYFFEKWSKLTPADLADAVLADTSLWGADLSAIPGFAQAIKENMASILETGVSKTIQIHQTKKVLA
ncbi:tagaturonate reductase [Niastella caeni]|uniref:Tagaturonate reductase n=1 Tax=Niastella caeni TaxID=2569763 RepID=A0A4S8HG61_9BACT|nr:tagaturonate reductase [Niastella caeni]THU34140.1 tagaturonate reductase [Niastella caeni]